MNKVQSQIIARLVEAIRERDRFLIATHIRPDGDAVGSLLAITFILRALGKRADPFIEDPVPPDCLFLPGAQGVLQERPNPSLYDAAVMVDCGELSRVGTTLADAISEIPFLINIDHHATSRPFGDVFWLEVSASSTCEMLYHLCAGIPLLFDSDIATQIYTGMLTDTGSFRFSNTNQRVLEIAARLATAGAKPDYIAQQVYDSVPPQKLHLLARVLSTLLFHSENRIATAEISLAMFAETAASPSDAEGFINHLRSVRSVEIAVLFREESDSLVHVSLRSKGEADVSLFARQHGGGGHRNAAACRVAGPLNDVRTRLTRQAMDCIR